MMTRLLCWRVLLMTLTLALPAVTFARGGGGNGDGTGGGGGNGDGTGGGGNQCDEGEVRIDGVCTPLVAYGAACESDAECSVGACLADPYRDGSTCQCPEGTYRDGKDVCAPQLATGEVCEINRQCLTSLCELADADKDAVPICKCADDAACGDDAICVDEMCLPLASHGEACEVDTQCAGDDACLEGICRVCLDSDGCAEGDYCTPDGSCAPLVGLAEACDSPAACAEGACIDGPDGPWCGECGPSDPCPAGDWCTPAAVCEAMSDSGEGCEYDGQCPGALGCVDVAPGDDVVGVCVQCSDDAPCGDSEYCAVGLCTPQVGFGEPCSFDGQCAGDRMCIAGACGDCATSAHCAAEQFCDDQSACQAKRDTGDGCDADVQCSGDDRCLESAAGAWICAACMPGDGTCGTDDYCLDHACTPRKPLDAACSDVPDECVVGAFCWAGGCLPKRDDGTPCQIQGAAACLSGACQRDGYGWSCAACSGDDECQGDLICGADGKCRDALEADYDPDLDLCGGGVEASSNYLFVHKGAATDWIEGSFTLVGGVVSAADVNSPSGPEAVTVADVDLANRGDTAPDDYLWIGGRGEVSAGVFGTSADLLALEASATRSDGEQDSTLLVEAIGITLYDEDVAVSTGWSFTMTFFFAQATFYAVKVSADVSGSIGFDAAATLGATGIALDVTPFAESVVTLFAGVGIGCLEAGLQATLTLLHASLPIVAQFGVAQDGISWTLDLNAIVTALSGDVSFVVDACFDQYQVELASWDGISVLDAQLGEAEGCIPF